MANDKLQELTEKLFTEGLSKGKEEGERILSQARAEAAHIVEEARAQAARTISEAQSKAEAAKAKAESDIRMAASQALAATKGDITEMILARSVDGAVDGALGNEEFAREIIGAVARAFSTEKSCDIAMVLPESAGKSLEGYVRKEVSAAIGRGIEVKLSKKIQGGLQIGPADGGYYISLSDESFKELIKAYLRPATRKILFGD